MVSNKRLRASDALYVEVIHTEVSVMGLPVAVGDVDFFPNGGVNQTGCQDLDCSHNRAWQLFAASLSHGGIIGYRCRSIIEALKPKGECTGFALPLGNGDLVKYGYDDFLADVYYTETFYATRDQCEFGSSEVSGELFLAKFF